MRPPRDTSAKSVAQAKQAGSSKPPPDDPIPALRRRHAIAVAAASLAAAALGSYNDFIGAQLGFVGLVAFSLLSGSVALIGSLGFSSNRPPAESQRGKDLADESGSIFSNPRRAPTQSQFRGRKRELEAWLSEHRRFRALRSKGDVKVLGPVVLALHGPPGTGKSALAQELARLLSADYPDGLVSANFGAGGTGRGAADIARDLLLQLGWPEAEVPKETEDRVATLRSLTRGRRMLFLFDAARDHDQVRQVLPAGAGCGVIITSRREIGTSLGLPPAEPLGQVSLEDGLEILASISGTDWVRDAQTAVEVVELCDRLPLPIRSAAERVRDGADIRFVAELLRPPASRLKALDYGGRSIRRRIGSEFDRLLPHQRQALVALSILDSETFVPWVLRSLLRLDPGRSTSVVTGLAAAQLVQHVGPDSMGQPRYRLPALVRLYATQHRAETNLTIEDAQSRFDVAYRELVDDVLAAIDPTYQRVRTGPRAWRSEESRIAQTIAPHLDDIVRREYLNLVRVIRLAPLPEYRGLVWRVAAMLDGRVPTLRDRQHRSRGLANGAVTEGQSTILAAFDRADEASRLDESAVGRLDVRLAQAQFLTAVERYDEALTVLDELADGLGVFDASVSTSVHAMERRLRIARVRASAYIQAGSYHDGHHALDLADEMLDDLPPHTLSRPYVQHDVELLILLNAAAERVAADSPRWTAIHEAGHSPQDTVSFRRALEESESLRRQGFWGDAAVELRRQLGRDGDARGRATVYYRLSRLSLDEAADLPTDSPGAVRQQLGRDAVLAAAASVAAFAGIGDAMGEIRARCLLVRALVTAGQVVAATQLSLETANELEAWPDNTHRNLWNALQGRHHRGRGEVQISRQSFQPAWRTLIQAAQTFRLLHDWRNHAQIWRLLERLDEHDTDQLADPF